MESKKINQLATELAPDLSDLTIIGDPTTGISKKITLSQMASLFTGTVEEYATLAAFPLVGVADTIYIALDTNIIYRYDTSLSTYVVLSPNIINSLVFSDSNGFDGTITLVGSVATLSITTALTLGSVPFIGASGALTQDNANLFFDDTNNRLGLGTNAPTTALDVFGSGIIGRINGTSTNNAFLGFSSAGTNKWSIGNVQSDHRFRIYNEATTSELVSVLSTGEFGIGIANPTTKFHIDGAASALIANLDANVSVAKSISFRSDNSNRINLEVSGTESGSNAGADLFIRRYSDAGALIDTPLTITRSTGIVSLASALPISSGGTGSITQNFVDLTTAQTIAGLKTFSSEVSASSGLITLSGNAGTAPTGMVGLRYVANRLLIYGGSTDFTIQKNSNASANLTILESGAATFASTIRSNDTNGLGIGSISGYRRLQYDSANTRFAFIRDDNGIANIEAGAATLSGELSITSGLLSISGSGGAPPTGGVGLRFVANRLLIYGGTQDITFQKNSNASANMQILEGGNVLIGTATDFGYRLVAFSDNGLLVRGGSISGHRPLLIQNSSSTDVFLVSGDGSIANPTHPTTANAANVHMTTGGTFYRSTSSLKYKNTVTDYDKGLDIVNQLRPVYYKGNNDGDTIFSGLIAEEVHDLGLTEFVQYAEDGSPDSLAYPNMVALAFKAIQELKSELDELKNK